LPDAIEIAVYYSIAEALTNAAKHADATFADVEVDTDVQSLRIEVRDDGRGGADLASGSGLVGIQDRIQVLGGRLTLESQPGAGTTLLIALPLP
jgi:signal transduction histidine kinase